MTSHKKTTDRDGALFLAVFILAVAFVSLGGCVDADQARRACRRSTQAAIEAAVAEVSESHLEKCKAEIDKTAANVNAVWQAARGSSAPERADCKPCEYPTDPCDDPPPCRWSDIDLDKISKWRTCAVPIALAHARWTKANCDPMPCHCN